MFGPFCGFDRRGGGFCWALPSKKKKEKTLFHSHTLAMETSTAPPQPLHTRSQNLKMKNISRTLSLASARCRRADAQISPQFTHTITQKWRPPHFTLTRTQFSGHRSLCLSSTWALKRGMLNGHTEQKR